jgi:cell division septal protein FtsQ
MKVRAPSEKNFRRAKVRPGKKKGWRSWVSWRPPAWVGAVALILYAGYRAFDLVVSAATLQVTNIAVRGNVRLSSGEVEALLDGLRGKSILTIDLDAHRRSLLQSSWVADVALRRVLPSTIDVVVSERQPIGLCRLGSDLYLVDGTGAIIDQYGPQYAEFDLPIVDGLVRAPGGKTQPAIDEERAALAARVLAAVAARRGLAAQVSQIDVSDAHDAIVLLDGDPALLHLGEERFAERIQAYLELAPTLRERVPDIDYVDLRFEERVYVRPATPRPGGGGRDRAKDKPSPAAVRKF